MGNDTHSYVVIREEPCQSAAACGVDLLACPPTSEVRSRLRHCS